MSNERTSVASPLTVAVVAHKSYRMPEDSVYLPLHVGAALHPDELTDWAQDNTGDNISTRNAEYSELTGLYWMWKNVNTPYKGLVHYRRYFGTKDVLKRSFARDRFERIASGQETLKMVEKNGIVLPKKRDYLIESVYSHYVHTIREGENQLRETHRVIREHAPEYLAAFDAVMSSRQAHMFNMMLMKRDKFDEYCSWLFPILEQVENVIDSTKYDAFNARYPGRISEMLLDVWLLTNGYQYVEMPVVNIEPVNWLKKGGAFLSAKFRHTRYTASF